jgi:hypothetical protein
LKNQNNGKPNVAKPGKTPKIASGYLVELFDNENKAQVNNENDGNDEQQVCEKQDIVGENLI